MSDKSGTSSQVIALPQEILARMQMRMCLKPCQFELCAKGIKRPPVFVVVEHKEQFIRNCRQLALFPATQFSLAFANSYCLLIPPLPMSL